MNPFSPEQINMICIYAEENRSDVIDNLRQMLNYLAYDEYELRIMAEVIIDKLEDMTDEEYAALYPTLYPDYDELEV